MESSKSGSDKELSDLERGEGSLDDVGDAETKSSDSVVGVLACVSEKNRKVLGFYIPSWRGYQS
jgi:hypothetical protein